jgi:hypothetical protein
MYWGNTQLEQKPAKNNERVANRTLSLKVTSIKTELDTVLSVTDANKHLKWNRTFFVMMRLSPH